MTVRRWRLADVMKHKPRCTTCGRRATVVHLHDDAPRPYCTVLLWLALVSWFPTPLPAADAHGIPDPPRRPAPHVIQVSPWWRGNAAGVVGAYASGVVGMLAGAAVAPWRERAQERKPPAA